MTLLFGTQFVVLEAYHLLFWNSCMLMPFFSVSSTCAKTWNLVHLSRFVFNGYSGHVRYFCCSYPRSVRVSGWWTYSQTWFHPSFYVFHFGWKTPWSPFSLDGCDFPPNQLPLISRNWRARLIPRSSLESDHRSRSTTLVPRHGVNHGGWLDRQLATGRRVDFIEV